MNGYYLWVSHRKDNKHPLDEAKIVLVKDKRVYVFGLNQSWCINYAQNHFGVLGAKLRKLG